MSIRNVGKDESGNERWDIDVHVFDPTVKKKRRYRTRMRFRSEKEARQYEGYARAMIRAGRIADLEEQPVPRQDPEDERKLALSEVAERYMKWKSLRHRTGECGDATFTKNGYDLRNHLLPILGGKVANDLRVQDIDDLVEELVDGGFRNGKQRPCLGSGSINNILDLLKAVLNHARKRGWVERMPLIERLPHQLPEPKWIDHDQLSALVSSEQSQWTRMVEFDARTGLRRGELRALRWTDIDWVKKRVLVRHNAWRDRPSKVKGRHVRYVPLSDDALRVLQAQKPSSFMAGALVFPDTNNSMLPDGLIGDELHRVCKLAGVEAIGWHVLRHTFGAHSVMAGIGIRVLQTWMGHQSVRTTERYASVAPVLDTEVNRLDDLARQHSVNGPDEVRHGRASTRFTDTMKS